MVCLGKVLKGQKSAVLLKKTPNTKKPQTNKQEKAYANVPYVNGNYS